MTKKTGMAVGHRSLNIGWVCVSMILGVVGCAPSKQMRGYIFPVQNVEKTLKVGMDRASVLQTLGTPVLVDPFDLHRWIYTQTRVQQKAFHHPEIIDQKTLVLSLDAHGTVERIDWVPSTHPLFIVPDLQKTPILGRPITEIQQMFRGIHHFHKKEAPQSEP